MIVIENKGHSFPEYASFFATNALEQADGSWIVTWDFSITDELQDATKFTCVEDALILLGQVVDVPKGNWQVKDVFFDTLMTSVLEADKLSRKV